MPDQQISMPLIPGNENADGYAWMSANAVPGAWQPGTPMAEMQTTTPGQQPTQGVYGQPAVPVQVMSPYRYSAGYPMPMGAGMEIPPASPIPQSPSAPFPTGGQPTFPTDANGHRTILIPERIRQQMEQEEEEEETGEWDDDGSGIVTFDDSLPDEMTAPDEEGTQDSPWPYDEEDGLQEVSDREHFEDGDRDDSGEKGMEALMTANEAIAAPRARQSMRVRPTEKMGALDLFSKSMERFFESAVVFATGAMPFTVAAFLMPDTIIKVFVYPLNLLLIPYVIVMAFIGAKLTDVLGCELWKRMTKPRIRARRKW